MHGEHHRGYSDDGVGFRKGFFVREACGQPSTVLRGRPMGSHFLL